METIYQTIVKDCGCDVGAVSYTHLVNCKFGYDINCEVVCEDGAIKMAQPSYPSIRKDAAVSTKIDTDCFVRFKDAYDTEVQNWVDCAKDGVINGPTAWDGYLAAVSYTHLDVYKRQIQR